ncbi:family 2 encapsulin nanocompartment cargo protein polyprenyl transferase [Sphaerisporangium fuscum]|uniref:family 2 encapsulin nanocompartment cargo protein polyprenyl transferase n=1 Tax=Sphaerisporangium fuscum TaxID=2835868 RepID=UPI002029A409|nr:family 2 encapsulin nanocompartment cargo protein polyprenyl transferase [Sphaerisporangium fuscum]
MAKVMTTGRPAGEVLAWSRDLVEPALRAAVETLPPSMRRIVGYHFGWLDEHGAPGEGALGKTLRPALVLLAAEAVGAHPDRPFLSVAGTTPTGSTQGTPSDTAGPLDLSPAPSAAAALLHPTTPAGTTAGGGGADGAVGPVIPAGGAGPAGVMAAAVAVELVHNFSLLHDDVMDGDGTRRHRPTAWRVFGVSGAILAGDALLALASDVLAASGHPAAPEATRILGAAVLDLVEGQSADVAFETRDDVTLPECVTMAEGKTGALLGAACALGALFGGGDAERIEHLRGFGNRLGLAFQLVDDLLGIWGNPAVTGKPVYSDLRNRKKSLPVVAALTSGTPAGKELAAMYGREQAPSGAELERAAALVDAAGGRAWSQERADHLLAEALTHLTSATPSPQAAAELHALAHLVTHRDH